MLVVWLEFLYRHSKGGLVNTFHFFWFLLEFCLFLHTMKWQISFSMLWNEQYSSKITCSIKDCKNSIKLSSLSLLKTKLTDFFFFTFSSMITGLFCLELIFEMCIFFQIIFHFLMFFSFFLNAS